MMAINWSGVDVHLDEGQRQATLLALAKLSIERPGWVWMLEQIALKMDNRVGAANDSAELFNKFRRLHMQAEETTPVEGNHQ